MLCLQCKLIEHNNHICSDLGPEAANHRIKLTNDQKTLTDSIKQVEELIRQCAKVSLHYHIEYLIKFAGSAQKGWQSLRTMTILLGGKPQTPHKTANSDQLVATTPYKRIQQCQII